MPVRHDTLGITQETLLGLLPQSRCLHEGTIAADVVWLGGLSQTLRFFFRPEVAAGTLSKVEAGESYLQRLEPLDAAFTDLLARLVSAFGSPARTLAGPFSNRYPDAVWEVAGVIVRHEVIDTHTTVHLLSINPK